MLQLPQEESGAPAIVLSEMNFGIYPMVNHQTRIATSLLRRAAHRSTAAHADRRQAAAAAAEELGLVTFTPDDIDWDDEVRIAIEERTSLSPDALTGMEANLRFTGAETMETRIFGRLTAWQNWIFNGPTRSANRVR